MPDAILLYRASCRKCRLLSRLAEITSCGTIHRVAMDAAAAEQLYERRPETRGKLALFAGERVWSGIGVVPAGLILAVRGLARALGEAFAGRARRSRGVTCAPAPRREP